MLDVPTAEFSKNQQVNFFCEGKRLVQLENDAILCLADALACLGEVFRVKEVGNLDRVQTPEDRIITEIRAEHLIYFVLGPKKGFSVYSE